MAAAAARARARAGTAAARARGGRARRARAACAAAAAGTLYDIPVSNNGARVRLLLYKAGLEGEVEIQSPAALGGLKSEEYLQLHPQGKMPLLVTETGLAVPESEVIVSYLLDKYPEETAPFVAPTVDARTRAALLTRLHDVYMCGAPPGGNTVMGGLYKPMGEDEREAKLASMNAQLDDIEALLADGANGGGPWLATSAAPSTADFALFPSMVFVRFMAPRFFGWEDPFAVERRPYLARWWDACMADADFARVHGEVAGALEGWADGGRWDKIGANEQVAAAPDRYKH